MIVDVYLQAFDLIRRESCGLGHLLEIDSIVRVSVGHGVVLCSACWAGCGVRLSGGRAGAGEVRWLQQPDRPGSARWGGAGADRGRATASQGEGQRDGSCLPGASGEGGPGRRWAGWNTGRAGRVKAVASRCAIIQTAIMLYYSRMPCVTHRGM